MTLLCPIRQHGYKAIAGRTVAANRQFLRHIALTTSTTGHKPAPMVLSANRCFNLIFRVRKGHPAAPSLASSAWPDGPRRHRPGHCRGQSASVEPVRSRRDLSVTDPAGGRRNRCRRSRGSLPRDVIGPPGTSRPTPPSCIDRDQRSSTDFRNSRQELRNSAADISRRKTRPRVARITALG
mgnify:CR=1 FL=1